MKDPKVVADLLIEKLILLQSKQIALKKEMDELHSEFISFKNTLDKDIPTQTAESFPAEKQAEKPMATAIPTVKQVTNPSPKPIKSTTNYEKYIGENLLSVIGIFIIIIGVGIGIKFAIDQNILSPSARLILGYIAGFALYFVANRLSQNYSKFSNFLLGGSLAITYLITFYGFVTNAFLLPISIANILALIIMSLVVAWSVHISIRKNSEWLAIIGMVGGYAVPMLLGDEGLLFGIYIALINGAILLINTKRKWNTLFITNFIIAWLMLFYWGSNNSFFFSNPNFGLLILVFFWLSYIAYIVYNISKEDGKASPVNIIVYCLNSFLFFTIGYDVCSYLTIFDLPATHLFIAFSTLLHALIYLYTRSKNYSSTIGLLMVASTLILSIIGCLVLLLPDYYVPASLCLFSATLLWLHCKTKFLWILYWSFAIAVIGLVSHLIYSQEIYSINTYYYDTNPAQFPSFLNIYFLASMIIVASFTFCYLTLIKNETNGDNIPLLKLKPTIWFLIFGLIALFYGVYYEILHYFDQLYFLSKTIDPTNKEDYPIYLYNQDYIYLQTYWVYSFILLFMTTISWLWIINSKPQLTSIKKYWPIILLIAIYAIIFNVLTALSQLNQNYTYLPTDTNPYLNDIVVYPYRVLLYILVAFSIYTIYKLERLNPTSLYKNIIISLVYIASIIFISSEYLSHVTDLNYKLGLSITWTVCAVIMIAIGIWQRQKVVRILAISLITFVIIKIFIYDINHLSTISKTIIFIIVGLLMLICSFLYNKFTKVLFEQSDPDLSNKDGLNT